MSDLYVHQPYPAWRFHATLGKECVENEAADKALKARDKGWVDTPDKVVHGALDEVKAVVEKVKDAVAPKVEQPIVEETPGLEEPEPEPDDQPRRRRAR